MGYLLSFWFRYIIEITRILYRAIEKSLKVVEEKKITIIFKTNTFLVFRLGSKKKKDLKELNAYG